MAELNRFHLNGLRAIEVVARHGTLARAAAELGTTPGAVSQLVIKAERQLGRLVFQRLPSGLKLTTFGDELVAHLEAGFTALSRGVASAGETQSQVLRVSTTLSFAEKWLVPKLPDFQASHPKIRVQIDSSLAVKDLIQSDVDIALRFGKGDWPSTKAEHLSDYCVFPVCSPSYARKLKVPEDLRSATIIRYENARESWDDWARAFGITGSLPDGLMFSEAALCVNAAIAGLGVALGWDILLAHEISEGRLVTPFEGHLVSDYSLWLVTAKSRGNDPKTSSFKSWIKRQLAT
jgi:LysR family transcriptional regulator, glycine cleavage system transcriptional activator